MYSTANTRLPELCSLHSSPYVQIVYTAHVLSLVYEPSFCFPSAHLHTALDLLPPKLCPLQKASVVDAESY